MGSLAWGGELDLRTDPGSLPSPSLWASRWGGGRSATLGLRFSMGWGWGGEPGDFIPQRHLAMSRGILLGVGVLLGSGGQGHRRSSPSFRTQDRAHHKGRSGPRCEDPALKKAQPSLTGWWIWGPVVGALTGVPLGLGALAVFNKGLLWARGSSFGKC